MTPPRARGGALEADRHERRNTKPRPRARVDARPRTEDPMALDRRCQGTTDALALAVGVMSRPADSQQRDAVRKAWGRSDRSVLACFIVGVHGKRTPVNPWAVDWKRAMDATSADPPRGQLVELAELGALRAEREQRGDVLLLNGSVEIISGGSSGLKTLPWWQHAAARLPGARWVGKCDDDTLLNLPNLLPRLSPLASPLALLGTISWACYSARRFKHERSSPRVSCGRTKYVCSRRLSRHTRKSRVHRAFPPHLRVCTHFSDGTYRRHGSRSSVLTESRATCVWNTQICAGAAPRRGCRAGKDVRGAVPVCLWLVLRIPARPRRAALHVRLRKLVPSERAARDV